MTKKKITTNKHVANSVRDLKSIIELEKLWYEKRDTSGKKTDKNIVEVFFKIGCHPNVGFRIYQNYFMNDLGNDVMWIDMTKILLNKSTYEGEFKDNEPHGKGVNTLPNGNVQEGEFREGGLWNGTYKDKDGNLISNVIEGNHYY